MVPEPSDPEEVSSTDEMDTLAHVAGNLDVSEDQLNSWIADGRIRAYRDRGDVYLKQEDVHRFMEEGDPPREADIPPFPEDTVPLDDLARFLDLSEEDLDGLLDAGSLRAVKGPGGRSVVVRAELARLLLVGAGRASLMEAAGVDWPDSGEPVSVLGETRAEDMEEDATDETSVRSLEEVHAPPRGAVTVRHFSRMNPGRNFPLLLQGARLTGPVRAVPRLPGCLCVPAGVDLTPDGTRAEFWITPQAVGPVPKAAVDLFVEGERSAEIRIPIVVRSLSWPWVLMGLAGAFLLLTPLLDLLGPQFDGGGVLGFLMRNLGGPVGVGILLSIVSFVAGSLLFMTAKPVESRPLTSSVSPSGPEFDEGP
ncbi:MAG: helix-turn-helix domain-containing protein [Planctomycetota bacterium]|jgi:excisionase family DNA binding protein